MAKEVQELIRTMWRANPIFCRLRETDHSSDGLSAYTLSSTPAAVLRL
jgi:hypothetical protein